MQFGHLIQNANETGAREKERKEERRKGKEMERSVMAHQGCQRAIKASGVSWFSTRAIRVRGGMEGSGGRGRHLGGCHGCRTMKNLSTEAVSS